MEALVIQELDSSSSIVWYFWHNNYQSATRSMNEWENCIWSIDISCVALVTNSLCHASRAESRLQNGNFICSYMMKLIIKNGAQFKLL